MKLFTASRPAHVKVICPTAAKMPVSLNSGFQMPSWFDLLSLDPDGKEDEAGIKRAAQLVDLLIDEEVKTSGLSSERVLVGGFSQVKYFGTVNANKYFLFSHTENIYTVGRSAGSVHGAAHPAQAGGRGGAVLLVPAPQADRGRDPHQQGDTLPPGPSSHPLMCTNYPQCLNQAHGDCDPVVPYKWGQLTSQKLREILPNHEFKSYKVTRTVMVSNR